MRKITTYLLLFFMVFTHSAIAMDTHALSSLISGGNPSSDLIAVQKTFAVDKSDCGDSDMHCSHSSSHVSGIVSTPDFSMVDVKFVYKPVVKDKTFVYTQAPPLRPPKA